MTAPLNSISVLVVDDVSLMRELLIETLEPLGCQVIGEAENGVEAISKIRQLNPDMVFLDIDMPKINGIEVLEEIKKEKLNPFSVIVSSESSFQNLKLAMSNNAKGFIVKPYSPEKIRQVIQKFKDQQHVDL